MVTFQTPDMKSHSFSVFPSVHQTMLNETLNHNKKMNWENEPCRIMFSRFAIKKTLQLQVSWQILDIYVFSRETTTEICFDSINSWVTSEYKHMQDTFQFSSSHSYRHILIYFHLLPLNGDIKLGWIWLSFPNQTDWRLPVLFHLLFVPQCSSSCSGPFLTWLLMSPLISKWALQKNLSLKSERKMKWQRQKMLRTCEAFNI